MSKIYIVYYEEDDYDSHYFDNIKAFRDKGKAESLVDELKEKTIEAKKLFQAWQKKWTAILKADVENWRMRIDERESEHMAIPDGWNHNLECFSFHELELEE